MDDVARASKMIAASKWFGISEAQAGVKIAAGAELGIGPVQSIQYIHVIPGGAGGVKVCLAAGLIGALIKRSPRYDYQIEQSDTKLCRLTALVDGKPIGQCEWTMSDAVEAGLAGKDNWINYPKDMLFARCTTRLARRFFPDVFGGPIYSPDEITNGETMAEPEPADFEIVEREGEAEDRVQGIESNRKKALVDEAIQASGGGYLPDWGDEPIGEDHFAPDILWRNSLGDSDEAKAIRHRFHKVVGAAGDDEPNDRAHWTEFQLRCWIWLCVSAAQKRSADDGETTTNPD
jgi:hypothetical protein